MIRRNLMLLMTMLLALTLAPNLVRAGDGIKERMLARVPAINALKAKGAIGENNKGYLEFVGGQQSGAAEVKAENEDRRQVYQAIAQQQGTTPELVGQRRALQISQSAALGTWLQAADGSWQKK